MNMCKWSLETWPLRICISNDAQISRMWQVEKNGHQGIEYIYDRRCPYETDPECEIQ
jgi:hypothetical protein